MCKKGGRRDRVWGFINQILSISHFGPPFRLLESDQTHCSASFKKVRGCPFARNTIALGSSPCIVSKKFGSFSLPKTPRRIRRALHHCRNKHPTCCQCRQVRPIRIFYSFSVLGSERSANRKKRGFTVETTSFLDTFDEHKPAQQEKKKKRKAPFDCDQAFRYHILFNTASPHRLLLTISVLSSELWARIGSPLLSLYLILRNTESDQIGNPSNRAPPSGEPPNQHPQNTAVELHSTRFLCCRHEAFHTHSSLPPVQRHTRGRRNDVDSNR